MKQRTLNCIFPPLLTRSFSAPRAPFIWSKCWHMMWLLTEPATRWSELSQLPKLPLSFQFKHQFNTETEGYYESFNMNHFRHEKKNTGRFFQTIKQICNFLNLKMSQENEWNSRTHRILTLTDSKREGPLCLK